ncbi:MAG: hypothetical protein Q8P83_00440 [bacterium]|nr:hypothetical protein [bacterium]
MTETNFIIQALIIAIVIGVYYSLYTSTKMYGGLIGTAVRYLGIGMLFITVVVLERIFINFGVIDSSVDIALVQDILSLIGLTFLALGFSKLAAVNKS